MLDRAALSAVVAIDPRECARKLLDLARQHAQAERAALYSLRNERLDLVTSQGIGADDLSALPAIWTRARARLVRGIPIVHERLAVAPIGTPPSALLYFGCTEPRPALAGALQQVVARLGPLFEAIVHSNETEGYSDRARRRFLEHTSLDDIEREQLALLLTKHEWNVARTARALQITRRGLYNKLRKFNLERPT